MICDYCAEPLQPEFLKFCSVSCQEEGLRNVDPGPPPPRPLPLDILSHSALLSGGGSPMSRDGYEAIRELREPTTASDSRRSREDAMRAALVAAFTEILTTPREPEDAARNVLTYLFAEYEVTSRPERNIK